MPVPRGERLLTTWALLAAALLHLAAHVGRDGSGREPLFEDGPALVANPAFELRGTEGTADVLRRAVAQPSAAWGEGGDVVGGARRRPVATALAAVERRWFGADAARGAALVSLALHLGVVLLTLRLLARTDAPRAARWLGATAVAASPAALTAAAWPAHQAVALAAALGLGGVVVAAGGGVLRGVLGGVAIAAAWLSHEVALGFAVVPAVLAPLGAPEDAARRRRGGVAAAAVVLGVFGVVSAVDPRPDVHGTGLAEAGATIARATEAVLLPIRTRFADGGAAPGGVLVALGAVVLAAGLWAGLRARGAAARLAAGAAWPAGIGLLAVGLTGIGGRPPVDEVVYLALPLAAGAVGYAVAAALRRGGVVRVAAAVAGAVWIGAAVAATAVRAPAFRTRAAHVALAERDAPESVVVAAWSFSSAVQDAARPDAAAADRLRALLPRADAFVRRVRAAGVEHVRGDPVAAVTAASAASQYAVALLRTGLAPGDPAFEAADGAAALSAELVPGWTRPWLVLANLRERAGDLQAAYEASMRAAELAPRSVDVLETGVRVSLAVGAPRLAGDLAETMLQAETALAHEEARRPDADLLLLYARAATADGVTRVPDPIGSGGLRPRYEYALGVLRDLMERGERVEAARRERLRTCLLYGDFLASLDRTALALLAYEEAESMKLPDPDLAERKRWLLERLAREERAAAAQVDRAATGTGSLPDALVALAAAFSRQHRWTEAEEVFQRLESELGLSAELRYHRALGVWRDQDPRRAIQELRQVVREKPALARAHHELARLLEEDGEYETALSAYTEARRLGLAQARDGAEEWILDADAGAANLRRLLQEAPRAAR